MGGLDGTVLTLLMTILCSPGLYKFKEGFGIYSFNITIFFFIKNMSVSEEIVRDRFHSEPVVSIYLLLSSLPN